jgi:hypothetical protein
MKNNFFILKSVIIPELFCDKKNSIIPAAEGGGDI